jgi:hypothetical protein
MTSKTDDFDAANGAEAYEIERQFGDIAPVHSDVAPTAADAKARGAADHMWQKVEEDLDRIDHIDRAESDEADNG